MGPPLAIAGTTAMFRAGPDLQNDVDTDGVFETHLWNCARCGCKLKAHCDIKATLHDLHCARDIDVKSWRCVGKKCARVHGPNFVWVRGEKLNTAGLRDFETTGVLFVSNKRAYTVRYLRFHENLLFRCFTSARGIDWVMKETFSDRGAVGYGKVFKDDYRKDHMDALVYFLAVQELEPLGAHTSVAIGKDIAESTFEAYNDHVHVNVFRVNDPSAVTVLVGDGHEKVLTKCPKLAPSRDPCAQRPRAPKQACGVGAKRGKQPSGRFRAPTMKRNRIRVKRTHLKARPAPMVMKKPAAAAAGRMTLTAKGYKRKAPRSAHHQHGWFMVATTAGHVVCALEQSRPEGNGIATAALERVIGAYPNVNCFIYDRCCAFHVKAQNNPAFKGIKYWCVDRLHARGHSAQCPCNPRHIARLGRRLKGVNSQACEQTFAWFRHYASVLNEMNPLKHKFLVLVLVRKHNECVAKRDLDHLPAVASIVGRGKRHGKYGCA